MYKTVVHCYILNTALTTYKDSTVLSGSVKYNAYLYNKIVRR